MVLKHLRFTSALLTMLAICAGSQLIGDMSLADDASKFDPVNGYRISRYRAPIPETVPGGKRVDVDEVERMIENGSVVLVDVMASFGPGPDKSTGKWRLSKPRTNIPGSIWLPDVGEGRITPQMTDYFKDNLKRATNGDFSKGIVIYCQADCWMSWNAVQRAAKLGYTNIYWYPEGTDGWRDWDGELVPATPIPLAPNPAAKLDQHKYEQ